MIAAVENTLITSPTFTETIDVEQVANVEPFADPPIAKVSGPVAEAVSDTWFKEIPRAAAVAPKYTEVDTERFPALSIVTNVPSFAVLVTVKASPRILASVSNLTIAVAVEPLLDEPSKRSSEVGIVILLFVFTDTCFREPEKDTKHPAAVVFTPAGTAFVKVIISPTANKGDADIVTVPVAVEIVP